MKPISIPATSALTAEEHRILAAFRAADDRSREMCTRIVERFAHDCPRRTAPALRLVSGGAA